MRTFALGLNQSRPLSILDIGTGPGYFPHVCNFYGHNAVGVDLVNDPLYNDLVSYLDVDRRPWCVKPFERSPDLGRKFDLVTAFLTCFNNLPTLWGPEEWDFFLRDLAANQVVADGRIILWLNHQAGGRPYNDGLRNFFTAKGAAIDRNRIHFTSLEGIRAAQTDRWKGLLPEAGQVSR